MRITYQVVATRAEHSGWCPVCGKRVVRQRRFEQTINPYNRNDIGAPKTYDEVADAVKAEAAAWRPDFTHSKCRAGADEGEPSGTWDCPVEGKDSCTIPRTGFCTVRCTGDDLG